jgi:hypothetical protein
MEARLARIWPNAVPPSCRALTVPQNSSAMSSGSSPASSQAPDSDLRLASVRTRERCEVGCDQDSVADSPLFERRRWRRRHQRRNFDASTDRGSFAGANDIRQHLFTGYIDQGRPAAHRLHQRRDRRAAGHTGCDGVRRSLAAGSCPDHAHQDFEPASARCRRQETRGLVSGPAHQEPTVEQQEYRPRETGR